MIQRLVKNGSEIREQRLSTKPTSDQFFIAVLWPKTNSKDNLGVLLRTCDALRATLVVPRGHERRLRAGCTHGLKNSSYELIDDPIQWLESFDGDVIGVDIAHGSKPLHDVPGPVSRKTAIIIGNESYGIPMCAEPFIDFFVELPMHGVSNSINVSVAASVVAYHLSPNAHLPSGALL